jgi:hypothetical protein
MVSWVLSNITLAMSKPQQTDRRKLRMEMTVPNDRVYWALIL